MFVKGLYYWVFWKHNLLLQKYTKCLYLVVDYSWCICSHTVKGDDTLPYKQIGLNIMRVFSSFMEELLSDLIYGAQNVLFM